MLPWTLLSPLQQAMVRGAAEVNGYSLREAFRRKVAKAGEACRQQGINFIPLASDTFGGCHGVAAEQAQKPWLVIWRGRGSNGSTPVPEALPAPHEGELRPPHQQGPYG